MTTLPVGASLLVLNPRRGESPMSLELRDIDMRTAFFEPNAIGLPPAGEKIQLVPARFESVPEVRERLDMALTADGRDAVLSIYYGNRKATLRLLPRGE